MSVRRSVRAVAALRMLVGRGSWSLALALISFSTISSSSARATDRLATFSLAWTRLPGAESCISSEALARELSERVDPTRWTQQGADFIIDGRVGPAASPARFRVRIGVTSSQGRFVGEREIVSDEWSCAAMTRSIVLVLLLILEAHAAPQSEPSGVPAAAPSTEPSRPAPAQAAALLTHVEKTPTTQPDRARLAAPTYPRGLQLSLAPALSWGLQPSLALSVHVAARWLTGTRYSLGAAFLFHRRTRLKTNVEDDGDVSFRAMQAALSACASLLRLRRGQLHVCAGGLLGWRTAETSGLAQARDPTRLYAGPTLGTELTVALTKAWHIVLNGGALAVTTRPVRFTYQDERGREQLLFRPPSFAAWAALGVGIRF